MAEPSTEQWQAERLSHWFVRGWGKSFAEHVSALDSGDSARDIELEPRKPQPGEWQAWEEPLWFDLAADLKEGAFVSVGCSRPTASHIATVIAHGDEDADTQKTYAELLNQVGGSLSKSVGEKLARSFEFSQARESSGPENADLGVEYVFTVQGRECVLAFVPNLTFLEAVQTIEKSQRSHESEQAAEDEAAGGDETLLGGAKGEEQSREEASAEGTESEAVSEGGDQAKISAAAAETAKEQASTRGGRAQTNLSMLLDIELDLSVSFGKTELPMQEVLKLASGSIVELNRAVSDPVEVLVNNCVIARGEVVVVEGNYGIRITEILSQKERIQSIF